MGKQITITTGSDHALTFYERLAVLRAANTQAHFDAALTARMDFESRIVAAVSARVNQVLDAITAD